MVPLWHLHEIQYDPNITLLKPQNNTLKHSHIIVSLLTVLIPCQHVVHTLPNIWYILVYHQKYLHKFSEEGFQNRIHQDFKCWRFIIKAKWHHQKLIMTFICSKGSFGDVFLPHYDSMIFRTKIQLGKENRSLHLI